ncbi:MAG: hypothetical protein HFJ02_06015 [Bacilli bacterium]|jgi:hypothetical protein|nr:hypothetical protein [Bacilli bacterium]
MQAFIDFLVNNYLWFIIVSVVLIFALIGYLVDTSEKPNRVSKMEDENPIIEGNQESIIESDVKQETINSEVDIL